MIPSKDEEALYRAMKRMAEDEPWRAGLASRAREMIASRYDCHYVRQCLLDFYDKIIAEKFTK